VYKLCLDIYTVMNKEKLQELREELGNVEGMLKAMIKSLENKHLNPGILDSLNPFSQLIGRRSFYVRKKI